jgi:hypothetical protein
VNEGGKGEGEGWGLGSGGGGGVEEKHDFTPRANQDRIDKDERTDYGYLDGQLLVLAVCTSWTKVAVPVVSEEQSEC